MLAESLSALLLGVSSYSVSTHDISGYSVVRNDCRDLSTARIYRVFRSFQVDRAQRELGVDVDTFETKILNPKGLECDTPELVNGVLSSRYGKALAVASQSPYPILNDGVRRAESPVNGTFLTADLCPASHEKQFERRFFDALETLSVRTNEPVPLALAVSGGWIRRHPTELDTILREIEKRRINVTWVNHSDTHPYVKGKEDTKNFLLEGRVNPNREILGVEMELLRRGLMPSVFFRFPGLVSNRNWVETVAEYSLIPLGSDAWLALHEKPKSGSIILVHANGNEPLGVNLFIRGLNSLEAIGPFLPLSKLF